VNKRIKIGVALALTITSISVFVSTRTKTIKPTTAPEYSMTSVMITRYDGRSGGSGVIISSNKNSSQILTNAHVCEVVKNGGIVRSDYAKGIVKNYRVSQIHDLCLITTNNNFKINTVVAPDSPELYEDAIVAGHPHLLPVIVTRGHFSQKELITILVGTKKCEPEDFEKEDTAVFCRFFGMIPEIRTYEAQVVSSTIMPGSSGSPVYNNKGEISGLVFAGSGNFGYAMIVPYEYISGFFEYELQTLPIRFPNELAKTPEDAEDTSVFTRVCADKTIPSKIKNVCELVSKSLLLLN
jgi:S1-C subfamily serine protease